VNTHWNVSFLVRKMPQRDEHTPRIAWCSRRKAILNSTRTNGRHGCSDAISRSTTSARLSINLFECNDLDWGLRLCMALFRFWDMREHLTEGRARLETILRLADSGYARPRARICIFLGALSTAQSDFAAAERFLQQGLSLYEELNDVGESQHR